MIRLSMGEMDVTSIQAIMEVLKRLLLELPRQDTELTLLNNSVARLRQALALHGGGNGVTGRWIYYNFFLKLDLL